jgi:hypothetical protein
MADNSANIAAGALQPKKVQGEQGSLENHPIPDQLQAERARLNSQVASRPLGGVRLTRVIPPASTGPGGRS